MLGKFKNRLNGSGFYEAVKDWLKMTQVIKKIGVPSVMKV